MQEEKEIQRKKKQTLGRKSIYHVLWGHVTKQVLGFVKAKFWEIHSRVTGGNSVYLLVSVV